MMGMVQSEWFFSIAHRNQESWKNLFRKKKGQKKCLPGQIQELAILMPDIQEVDANWVLCTQPREVCAVGDTYLTASAGLTMGVFAKSTTHWGSGQGCFEGFFNLLPKSDVDLQTCCRKATSKSLATQQKSGLEQRWSNDLRQQRSKPYW